MDETQRLASQGLPAAALTLGRVADVGQQRELACALDRRRDLALVAAAAGGVFVMKCDRDDASPDDIRVNAP